MHGHSEVADALLATSADQPDDSGATALQLAAQAGHTRTVQTLLGQEDEEGRVRISLTRTAQGFGLELDDRGAVAGYSGEGRPAVRQAPNLPLALLLSPLPYVL